MSSSLFLQDFWVRKGTLGIWELQVLALKVLKGNQALQVYQDTQDSRDPLVPLETQVFRGP